MRNQAHYQDNMSVEQKRVYSPNLGSKAWRDRLNDLPREDLVDLATVLLTEIEFRTGDFWKEADETIKQNPHLIEGLAPWRMNDDVFAILTTACTALGESWRGLLSRKADGLFEGLDEGPRMVAAKGGKAAAANDPRQVAKGFVYECWKAWRADPARYRGKAAFARDMLDKCDTLKSKRRSRTGAESGRNRNPASRVRTRLDERFFQLSMR